MKRYHREIGLSENVKFTHESEFPGESISEE